MILDRAIRNLRNETSKSRILSLDKPDGRDVTADDGQTASMKISAVNRCVACLTESMSKLPIHIIDGTTRSKLTNHPLSHLLSVRPNEAMTPSVYKKLLENNRLLDGNGYAVILRNRYDAGPEELLPIRTCTPYVDENGRLYYIATNPRSGEMRKLSPFDVLHYKAYSNDGIKGVSVLTHAAQVIRSASATQRYEEKFFSQGARPGGVLTVDGDLDRESKDKIRAEWARIHSGVDNAFRIAVLDLGLSYQPIGINNRDAQFVESKAVTVEDIARFFGVPLYKLFAGKQAYNSNEQNGIEYVVNTLSPNVMQYDEEDSYKLLFDWEIARNLWVNRNMMAELKGDVKSRAEWYKAMREVGAYSPNDILRLEDEPDVEGGDTRYASLNYVPLELFRELSINRNKGDRQ